MADSKSGDDVRRDHERVLGSSLGPTYHALWNEFYYLQFKWQEYRVLFATSEARVDLLNAAAETYFALLEDVLWDDILLHIARLTDKKIISGHANLTFRLLPDLVDDSEIKRDLTTLVEAVVAAAAFATPLRHKRLAHKDLSEALGASASPVPGASRQDIHTALKAMHDVLAFVSQKYFGSQLEQIVLGPIQGAEALLYILRDGVMADRRRRERLGSGEILPEDLEPPEPI